uniref:Helicase ATP-binding domain-containing protein n=1 Tax=viral metagenome TaxID=1070528 RepID=A0A6C0E100_9ZZZZ
MNPLETLKDQLKMKPRVHERDPVVVRIDQAFDNVPDAPVTVVIDKRDEGYNREQLLERIKQKKLSKVVPKKQTEQTVIIESKAPEIIGIVQKPKVKKLKTVKQFTILEDEEDQGNRKVKETHLGQEEAQLQLEEPREMELEIQDTKKRRTKKLEKGVVELGPEHMIEIGDTSIKKRLPVNPRTIDIKVSSYFMNNREIFVNFINGLFEPYKDDLLDDTKNITCDNIGNDSDDVQLLTHQKIVRDYINLYTPYRGLLLYHGLGSGKTASSISIAEGFTSTNKVIVLTPASLRRNYLEEIKKYGDMIYRKNQYWEWISYTENPETLNTLSAVLGLPREYIRRKQGAWLVNITKPNNYSTLSSSDKKSLDDQLDEMIQNKYTFINYNGLRRDKFKQLTNNFETNIFDNAVVIIDEAHNLISRMVNKINKMKKFKETERGPNARLPAPLALQIYEFLLRANNCRIVLLSGTPIINYPNEIGILFNILRGYIKTWQFTLSVETTNKLNKDTLLDMFAREKVLDYIDYSSSSKILTVTRNPYGFDNKITEKSGYKGVTNEKKERREGDINDRGMLSDEDFVKRIVKILKKNDITAIPKGTHFQVNTALPDTLDEFINLFVEKETGAINNIEKFKKRILGLTSFFRSAQEELLPRYNKNTDYHVIKLPMSNYQFKIYEEARQEERKVEKPKKSSGNAKVDKDGLFVEPTSTYRIFSRLFCNFVMPKPPGRPKPVPKGQKKGKKGEEEKEIEEVEDRIEEFVERNEEDGPIDLQQQKHNDREIEELEGDELLDMMGDDVYRKNIKDALHYLKAHSADYLSPEGLETYSPKFLAMLENIQDPDHPGLHLIYSQFRSMEGIGIFCLVLEQNGFAQFKIKKQGMNDWVIDMKEEDVGKPTFALYTGTEEAEEREIIRNIYNGSWNYVPTSIASQLKKISNNNNMGEIIKVFMITAAGSEGINLRNTRYVHLMEPYWHPVRLEQVIGRARRICSHKDLPAALQTVEVFLYLMTFTAEQLNSNEAIELKISDLSKRRPFVPITSDEKLFEISTIKEELNTQLLKGIKESSIDCAIHVKSSSKENLKCLSFGQPPVSAFAYNPNYSQDENDTVAVLNRATIEWVGREFKFNGKQMILREETKEVYDYESYQQALQNPGIRPILLGRLEKKDGKYRIVKTSIV